jgi:ABC-type amino acid transport system permease subunit
LTVATFVYAAGHRLVVQRLLTQLRDDPAASIVPTLELAAGVSHVVGLIYTGLVAGMMRTVLRYFIKRALTQTDTFAVTPHLRWIVFVYVIVSAGWYMNIRNGRVRADLLLPHLLFVETVSPAPSLP